MKLKTNRTHMQGAGENVTHPLRSFASGAPKPWQGAAGSQGASTSSRRQGPGPRPDAAQVGRAEPRQDTRFPCVAHQPWPQFCCRQSPLRPAFGAPSRPGFLAAGVADFGVRAIRVCMPTPHLPGAYISSPFWASLILMFWVAVGLEMEYLVSGTEKEIITL